MPAADPLAALCALRRRPDGVEWLQVSAGRHADGTVKGPVLEVLRVHRGADSVIARDPQVYDVTLTMRPSIFTRSEARPKRRTARMNLSVLIPPAVDPVTPAEAMIELRLVTSADDAPSSAIKAVDRRGIGVRVRRP